MQVKQGYINAADITKRKQEEQYWHAKLKGTPINSTFFRGLDEDGILNASKVIVFEDGICERLLSLSNNSDERLFILLYTLLALLQYKQSSEQDIMFGIPVVKQEDILNDSYINSLLLIREFINSDITFKQLLLSINKTILDAYSHQNYPIQTLLYKLNNDPDMDEVFEYVNTVVILDNIHGSLSTENAKCVSKFIFSRINKSIKCELRYNDKLELSEVELLFYNFQNLIRNTIFNIDEKVESLSLLSSADLQELLFKYNKTEKKIGGESIIDLFSKQIEASPDGIAISCGEESITYKELNDKSNSLANHLLKKGVYKNSIVSVIFEPSIEMVVSILAVLKAGCAYLPVNPNDPFDRIEAILDDSKINYIIAQDCILKKFKFTKLQALHKIDIEPILTNARPSIVNLDELPMTNRSFVNYERYNKYIGFGMQKYSVSLQATRGCPYMCAYCHKIWPKKHFKRSAENIFEEVKLYYSLGIKRFSFVDDIFNLDKKNSERFFELIIENKLDVQLNFPSGLRGDILTKDYIDLLVKAGTTVLGLSLETACSRLQKLIGKNLDIERLRENIIYICEKYPHVILEVFTMHGFPSELEEEALMTLDFIKDIKWIHFPYVNILKIYPNTDMAELAQKHGISEEDILASEDMSFHELPLTLPFSKDFTTKYQTDFLYNYILSKERLLKLLPYQMKVLTEDELVQKYDSYLPFKINSFSELLKIAHINEDEISEYHFKCEDEIKVIDLDAKLKEAFTTKEPKEDALRVLLIDVTLYFTHETEMLYNVFEPPLGLMSILSYLDDKLDDKVQGKIVKSCVDFDNYEELKNILDEFKPDVIGVRALSYYKHFFHRTISKIRSWDIDVPIVVGGPYVTSTWRSVLQDFNIDVAIIGEGEITFAELMEEIIKNDKKLPSQQVLTEIKGLAFIPQEVKLSSKQLKRDIIIVSNKDELTNSNIDLLKEFEYSPSDLMYVLYTSGSSGTPKGVMIEQQSVINLISWFSDTYKINKDTKAILLANYTFDTSIEEIFGTILNGGTLYIVGNEEKTNIKRLKEIINEKQINIINTTPTLIRFLFDDEVKNQNIKTIISGGEKLDIKLRDSLLDKGYDLYNNYGLTETTVDILSAKCCKGEDTHVGRPIFNTKCYILDKNNKPVPKGMIGELCVAGVGVSKGYINSPELNSSRFITSPLDNSQIIFKTGDYAKMLSDCSIMIMGRIDNQIKIRGYRIELAEIETSISKHSDINEVAVIYRKENNQEALIAFYTSNRQINSTELIEFIENKIPEYMIPQHFIQIENMPLNNNGKIDSCALQSIKIQNSDETFIAPSSKIEMKLAEIWARVLKIDIDSIGVKDNFFALGGNSLNTHTVLEEIAEELNVELSVPKFFQMPTIEQVSYIINKNNLSHKLRLKKAGEKTFYEISPAQRRVVNLQKIDDLGVRLNMTKVVHFTKEPDLFKLEEALNEIIKRHEILRTTFFESSGKMFQIIHENLKVKINTIQSNSNSLSNEIKKIIVPFKSDLLPLINLTFIKITDTEEFALVVDLHHLVADYYSIEMIIESMLLLYADNSIAENELQYKDFSESYFEHLKNGVLKNQKDYWMNSFSDSGKTLRLPTDLDRGRQQSLRGEILEFSIDEDLTNQIKCVMAEQHTTMFTYLLSTLYITLYKLTQQEDITIGTQVKGRNYYDVDNVIGMFVNILPLRCTIKDSMTANEILHEVKKVVLRGLDNQDYFFEDLLNDLNMNSDNGHHPLFDVCFILKGNNEKLLTLMPENKIKCIEAFAGIKTSICDFSLIGEECNGRINLTLEYCIDLFEEKTMNRIKDLYITILRNMTDNIDSIVADINN